MFCSIATDFSHSSVFKENGVCLIYIRIHILINVFSAALRGSPNLINALCEERQLGVVQLQNVPH